MFFLKRSHITLVVLLSSFLSFYINFFNAANNDWFKENQLTSEQLVLDGVLHASTDTHTTLGRYHRPVIGADPHTLLYELYQTENKSGTFKPYTSQFGFQVILLKNLKKLGFGDLRIFHALSAGLLSIIITALFYFCSREFGNIPALVGASCLLLGPWFVVFAKNLYFIPFTWLLPTLVTTIIAINHQKTNKVPQTLFFLLFLSYLFNILCGYEFLTSAYISSSVPIVYLCIKNNTPFWRVVHLLGISFVYLVAAFLLGITIHAKHLSNDLSEGLSQIASTASKRVNIADPEDTVNKICNDDLQCKEKLKSHLNVSTVKVIAKYTVFPAFLPWTSHHFPLSLPCSDPPGCSEKLRSSWHDSGLIGAASFTMKVVLSKDGVIWILSRIAFLNYLLFIVYIGFKTPIHERLSLILAFLGPISWFIAAKAHSDAHYHMNYVIWYLPFIPFSAMVATKSLLKKFCS